MRTLHDTLDTAFIKITFLAQIYGQVSSWPYDIEISGNLHVCVHHWTNAMINTPERDEKLCNFRDISAVPSAVDLDRTKVQKCWHCFFRSERVQETTFT